MSWFNRGNYHVKAKLKYMYRFGKYMHSRLKMYEENIGNLHLFYFVFE